MYSFRMARLLKTPCLRSKSLLLDMAPILEEIITYESLEAGKELQEEVKV